MISPVDYFFSFVFHSQASLIFFSATFLARLFFLFIYYYYYYFLGGGLVGGWWAAGSIFSIYWRLGCMILHWDRKDDDGGYLPS